MDMFCQDDNTLSTALAETESAAKAPRTSLTYEEVVKDLISDEKQHLRDLHMIIKVFREELGRLIPPDDIKVAVNVFFRALVNPYLTSSVRLINPSVSPLCTGKNYPISYLQGIGNKEVPECGKITFL